MLLIQKAALAAAVCSVVAPATTHAARPYHSCPRVAPPAYASAPDEHMEATNVPCRAADKLVYGAWRWMRTHQARPKSPGQKQYGYRTFMQYGYTCKTLTEMTPEPGGDEAFDNYFNCEKGEPHGMPRLVVNFKLVDG
jgi:hypothetical protein